MVCVRGGRILLAFLLLAHSLSVLVMLHCLTTPQARRSPLSLARPCQPSHAISTMRARKSSQACSARPQALLAGWPQPPRPGRGGSPGRREPAPRWAGGALAAPWRCCSAQRGNRRASHFGCPRCALSVGFAPWRHREGK